MTEKPEPCPFCGGNDISILNTFAFCEDCSGEGPAISEPGETAIALWNRRPGLHLPEPGTVEFDAAVHVAWTTLWDDSYDSVRAAILAAAGRTE